MDKRGVTDKVAPFFLVLNVTQKQHDCNTKASKRNIFSVGFSVLEVLKKSINKS